MTPNEIAADIMDRFRKSIVHGEYHKLDLQKLIKEALEKVAKEEYKRGYKTAKEKFRRTDS